MTLSTTKTMILLGLLRILQGSTATFDCNIGCSLDSSEVCGNDGITYPNECFAVCQTIAVAYYGPCKATGRGSMIEINETSTELQGFVTVGVMKRFSSEGYTYVRKVNIAKISAPTEMPMSDFNGTLHSNPLPVTFRAIRLTSDGHEYKSKEIMVDQMGPPRLVKGSRPQRRKRVNGNNSTRRELKVIGSDGRRKISNTKVSPYMVIGRLEMGCTGTVIYKSAVLTAGHCVFDSETLSWTKTMAFTPGKNGPSEPYGRWKWETVTTYQGYIDSKGEDFRFDMAVIKYKKNASGKTLGNVVGYAGLDEVSSFDDPDLDKSVITGYPADKAFGEMWTSGYCPSGYWPAPGAPSSIAYHNCDTFGGHSGSALLRPVTSATQLYARGVHIFGCDFSGCNYNGANVFLTGSSHFQSAIDWSGRLIS